MFTISLSNPGELLGHTNAPVQNFHFPSFWEKLPKIKVGALSFPVGALPLGNPGPLPPPFPTAYAPSIVLVVINTGIGA